jgi:hypothetical protein
MDQTLFFLSNQVFELVASSYTKFFVTPLNVNDVQTPHYNMLSSHKLRYHIPIPTTMIP